jgi:hypothetical protein
MASINTGLFVPTTDNYDLTGLQGKDLGSDEFKQFMIKLMQRTNQIALALNLKDSALYYTQEFVNGQTFYPPIASPQTAPPRQVFRKVINFGALPNTATKTVAHGINVTTLFSFTRIYGCASDTTTSNFIPLPFINVSGAITGNIELSVDGTNVYVTTAANSSNFDTTYIILEYLKN